MAPPPESGTSGGYGRTLRAALGKGHPRDWPLPRGLRRGNKFAVTSLSRDWPLPRDVWYRRYPELREVECGNISWPPLCRSPGTKSAILFPEMHFWEQILRFCSQRCRCWLFFGISGTKVAFLFPFWEFREQNPDNCSRDHSPAGLGAGLYPVRPVITAGCPPR